MGPPLVPEVVVRLLTSVVAIQGKARLQRQSALLQVQVPAVHLDHAQVASYMHRLAESSDRIPIERSDSVSLIEASSMMQLRSSLEKHRESSDS